jgi:DnaJ family protein A protein 2
MKVIHGQGMPSQRHHEPGDLYVKFQVVFPDRIDPGVISFLEKALPSRKPQEKFPKNVLLEEVSLDEIDSRYKKRAQRMDGGDPMDEDEPEDGARVQCANQ